MFEQKRQMSIHKRDQQTNVKYQVSLLQRNLSRPDSAYLRRHNQDLQKELAQAKLQVKNLRSMIECGMEEGPVHHDPAGNLPVPEAAHNHNLSHLPDPESQSSQYAIEQFPGLEARQTKRQKTAGTIDFSVVGNNMQKYGRGIFKLPYPQVQSPSPPSLSGSLPDLPSKHEADMLLRQYQYTMHPTLPMVHWPSFQEQYETVYRSNSLDRVPSVWIALLYAVFACGALHRSWQEGMKYLEISRSLIDMWTEELTLDHVRTALLSSIFLVEMNLKSAGWTYIGCAVRISFDIGLHCEAGTWSTIEEEMRRRVWWCVYSCDW